MKKRQQMYHRFFVTTGAAGAMATPGNVIYNDNEIGLPDFFALRTERIPQGDTRDKMESSLVYINWQTTTEKNTRHFELQRSENGKDFAPIEIFMASGNSKSISRYATTDLIYSFCFSRLYYRLKVVFTNGNENFTDAIALDLNTVRAASVYDLTFTRNQQ